MNKLPIDERFQACYERLIDETENPNTCQNRKKNEALRLLVEVFEFVSDEDCTDNPLDDLFGGTK